MLELQIDLVGVEERLQELTEIFKARAQRGVEILWHQLYQEIQINLSNNVLNIRTGNLIGSLEYTSYIESYSDVITAQAGVNTIYAAYQEFGFDGIIQTSRGFREIDYSGRPYVRPALAEIAKNVGAVLSTEINNGD